MLSTGPNYPYLGISDSAIRLAKYNELPNMENYVTKDKLDSIITDKLPIKSFSVDYSGTIQSGRAIQTRPIRTTIYSEYENTYNILFVSITINELAFLGSGRNTSYIEGYGITCYNNAYYSYAAPQQTRYTVSDPGIKFQIPSDSNIVTGVGISLRSGADRDSYTVYCTCKYTATVTYIEV